jgi:hypothetical protein
MWQLRLDWRGGHSRNFPRVLPPPAMQLLATGGVPCLDRHAMNVKIFSGAAVQLENEIQEFLSEVTQLLSVTQTQDAPDSSIITVTIFWK